MAYLTLENGKTFKGKLIGSKTSAIGEVVFNTGMTGYQETITDPSYYGQIVTMTYPLIGNYGVNIEDLESAFPQVKAFVVRELCEIPSNWRSIGTLDDYLKTHNITGIQGVDTRELTRIIRENGTMRGIISEEEPTSAELEEMKNYQIKDAMASVSCKEKYTIEVNNYNVAVIDYGLKRNILKHLKDRGLNLTVFPLDVKAETILNGGFDGVMLTNGPGDPKDNPEVIENLRNMLGKIPIFGICMGHQILALANGGNTKKLKYGHRGANHPVKDLINNKMYITSQNHGYVVEEESLPEGAKVTFVNWNDKTVEGVSYNNNSFSVQFHPEASAGPNDAGYLFDNFMELMDRCIAEKQK